MSEQMFEKTAHRPLRRETPRTQGTPNRPCGNCGVVYDWRTGKHPCRVDTKEKLRFRQFKAEQMEHMRRLAA